MSKKKELQKIALDKYNCNKEELCKMIDDRLDVYLVGSAVRDAFCGLEPSDRDYLVVGSSHEEMTDLGFECVGQGFPCYLHPVTSEEYALARTERRSGSSHQEFDFNTKDAGIVEDLSRRDFTMNAVAYSFKENCYIDPFGGIPDIEQGIIRHVSPAFKEDPLRILRACRFMAKLPGFEVDQSTWAMMMEMVCNGEISNLTPERIWMEIKKTLKYDFPSRFLVSMKDLGVGDVVFPEIVKLKGIPQRSDHHPEGDVFTHAILTLDAACRITKDPVKRWAALCHDIGKGTTDPSLWPHHYGHGKNGIPVIKAMCNRLKAPSKYTKAAMLVSEMHEKVHFKASASSIRRMLDYLQTKHSDKMLNLLLTVAIADRRGRGPQSEDVKHENVQRIKRAAKAYRSVEIREGLECNFLIQSLVQDRVNAIKAAIL